jgi:hypothetical protein
MPIGPERYPYIPLRKALERARQLWDKAGDHPVISSDAVAIWKFSPKASGGHQTIAALKYYGIVQDSGSNETRKIKVTEEARRYFLDERPEKHAELHKYFALKPRSLAALWEMWHAKPPSEPIARSALKIDLGYSENAAADLLAIYTDNLVFAGLSTSDAASRDTTEAVEDEVEWDGADPKATERASKEVAMQEPQRAPAQHRMPQPDLPTGLRSDICNIPEGTVVLSFPEEFSQASLEDIEAWLDFQKNRLKRWVKAN